MDKTARPTFPQRAVITAGMPYGNKDLHFGHVGGVFVHADVFARFLRDRLGRDNVIFVSGTDCYGSSIVEDFRVLVEEKEYDGTIHDFVRGNYDAQREVLEAYDIDLNLFAASSLDRPAQIHRDTCAAIITELHARKFLEKRTTLQFYDPVRKVVLNGRQVIGRCPIRGCRSEKAYADECSLGHQYEPRELIQPKSTLSGTTPTMLEVANLYFKLPEFRDLLAGWVENIARQPWSRPFMVSAITEFLEPPVVYLKQDDFQRVESELPEFPAFTIRPSKSESIGLAFETLDEREQACALLAENGYRFRTGKTLVPFRLTGNADWGLPVPDLEDLKDLTFWVWPESLFAPISFTSAVLEEQGKDNNDWKEWWCSKDANVFQFIGEDNIFFYGPAEMAMFMGLQKSGPGVEPADGEMQLPVLVANKHLLFLSKKASSSGAIKPPMARDLLNHYTSDQLRAHFLSFGLGMQNANFQPKPLNPTADERAGDPVLKEGNLLSNVLNRAVRTCFYTMQKHFDGKIPIGEVTAAVKQNADETILKYEEHMYLHQFHAVMETMDVYIRGITRHWSENVKKDEPIDPQVLIDSFHMVRVATLLMHPIAPHGTEIVREYLNVGEDFWNWNHVFDTLYSFMDDPATHRFKVLEPRVDFFEKHPSQYRKK